MSYTSHRKAVEARAARAQIRAVNRTMGESVESAQASHEWQNRTGILEGSIKIVSPAHREGNGASGEWGSVDVVYAAIHEFGGQAGADHSVTIPPRPYLRPAADRTYPKLPKYLRQEMARP